MTRPGRAAEKAAADARDILDIDPGDLDPARPKISSNPSAAPWGSTIATALPRERGKQGARRLGRSGWVSAL